MSGRGAVLATVMLLGIGMVVEPAGAQHHGPPMAMMAGPGGYPGDPRPRWNDQPPRPERAAYPPARCHNGGDALLGAIAGGLIGGGGSRSDRVPPSSRAADRNC